MGNGLDIYVCAANRMLQSQYPSINVFEDTLVLYDIYIYIIYMTVFLGSLHHWTGMVEWNSGIANSAKRGLTLATMMRLPSPLP